MSTSEALGAVLAGSAEIDGELVRSSPTVRSPNWPPRSPRSAAEPVLVEPTAGLAATLRPYQRRGLAWLAGHVRERDWAAAWPTTWASARRSR